MSNTNIVENNSALTDLAQAHTAYAAPSELGADAAAEAPATSPLCIGIIVGATLGAGC
ncbi:hypothetical protein [Glutamicibacter sp. M10]|uniref:hypothetical protein n=1 Tax=Glutamicibacter sp. M10 TaxID=3023076 RepID=UPI0021C74129|nr:hypothetical protein [Glutamicibacter sp. M10]UXN32477.1 hypothetical protein N6V40_03075 [Glutamicibacter sp. M10]